MKKFFDIVMPVKTAACYIFTATMCVYAVLDLVFGWGGLPDNYLFSFLLLSLAGGVLQIVAFTELVIKRLRYTLRLFVFAVPYLAVLSAIAAGFGWLPAAQPGAWALTTRSYEPLLKEQIFSRDNSVLPQPDRKSVV